MTEAFLGLSAAERSEVNQREKFNSTNRLRRFVELVLFMSAVRISAN
jgi:hypothetical protein